MLVNLGFLCVIVDCQPVTLIEFSLAVTVKILELKACKVNNCKQNETYKKSVTKYTLSVQKKLHIDICVQYFFRMSNIPN